LSPINSPFIKTSLIFKVAQYPFVTFAYRVFVGYKHRRFGKDLFQIFYFVVILHIYQIGLYPKSWTKC